jgi:hypothetical protein
MTRDQIKNKRLVGLFLLGWVVFNFPILSLFDLDRMIFGIPLLYVYIFGAWALLIVLMALNTGVRASKFKGHTDK